LTLNRDLCTIPMVDLLQTKHFLLMNIEQPPSISSSEQTALEQVQPEQAPPEQVVSSLLLDLQAQLGEVTGADAKLRYALAFMRDALSQPGTPRFRDFWEARRLSLPFFKENLAPAIRSELWAEYVELSSEARRLKEILDEQSAFAAEQIELAISSVEQDLDGYQALLEQIVEIPFPRECRTLYEKIPVYQELQRELYFLNTFAHRINGLRKEIIKTEMRIKHKNKFFDRLSASGDRIFPQRKELIAQISDTFLADIQGFVTARCGEEAQERSLFGLREEIKMLQTFAKMLTLNTHAFTKTRQLLSDAWDLIKIWEKERKKDLAIKKEEYRVNYDRIALLISELAELCRVEGTLVDTVEDRGEEILEEMRAVTLGWDEVRSLREELARAKAPVLDKVRFEEEERERKARELAALRLEALQKLKANLSELLHNGESVEGDALQEKRDLLIQDYETMNISKAERIVVDKLFKQLKELIVEKRERRTLTDSDLQSLEELRAILQQRRERAQEIQQLLEQYRKVLGGSNLDFEKAFLYRQLFDEENVRFKKSLETVVEIEDKIRELEA